MDVCTKKTIISSFDAHGDAYMIAVHNHINDKIKYIVYENISELCLVNYIPT